METEKKTVLITGADAGLGLSLVKRFLQGGFAVFAGVHRSMDSLNVLASEYGDPLSLILLNVADLESVRAAARLVDEQTNSLDIIINNAGIHLDHSKLPLEQLDLSDQHLQRTMDVNAFGPLRVVQQFLSLMEKGERKLVLNISSEAGSIADSKRENQFVYCMSKAALNMQSKILHNYLKPRGFNVLVVHPGWMRTNMGGPSAAINSDEPAAGIFDLAAREPKPGDPIYIDYRGEPLPW